MVDLVGTLHYYPVALSFDSLSSSDSEKVVHCDIKKIPAFEYDIDSDSTGNGRVGRSWVLSFHANLYWNCLNKGKKLTSKEFDRYTDILLGFENVDEYYADNTITTCASAIQNYHLCHPMQDSYGMHQSKLFSLSLDSFYNPFEQHRKDTGLELPDLQQSVVVKSLDYLSYDYWISREIERGDIVPTWAESIGYFQDEIKAYKMIWEHNQSCDPDQVINVPRFYFSGETTKENMNRIRADNGEARIVCGHILSWRI
ncbi:unnamed protein product [Ambrosiozyma monospora]|uniref:Unnamed protein product n=1 Tax=Ambrosiozyma monospora TaxID=43982 RepID=A0ACB5TA21_AMBMO|nr:unnamed protein product [Ambrosiozyma monospora]